MKGLELLDQNDLVFVDRYGKVLLPVGEETVKGLYHLGILTLGKAYKIDGALGVVLKMHLSGLDINIPREDIRQDYTLDEGGLVVLFIIKRLAVGYGHSRKGADRFGHLAAVGAEYGVLDAVFISLEQLEIIAAELAAVPAAGKKSRSAFDGVADQLDLRARNDIPRLVDNADGKGDFFFYFEQNALEQPGCHTSIILCNFYINPVPLTCLFYCIISLFSTIF